jgi:PIN domain nuclease of toxin-antitoxin system
VGSPELIVLDTDALIWLTEEHPWLGGQARRLADNAFGTDQLAVSAISFWETAMLHQRNRISLVQPVDVWRLRLLEVGLPEIPVCGEVGIAAARLVDHHSDPADRMITATATLNRATLITADERILAWSGALDRHDARN